MTWPCRVGACGVAPYAVLTRQQPGGDGRAGRNTERSVRNALSEQDAFGSDRVKVRGQCLATGVGADRVGPLLVRRDHEDVGAGPTHLTRRAWSTSARMVVVMRAASKGFGMNGTARRRGSLGSLYPLITMTGSSG